MPRRKHFSGSGSRFPNYPTIVCRKQVFITQDYARNTVRLFKSKGIQARVVKCSNCRWFHVEFLKG